MLKSPLPQCSLLGTFMDSFAPIRKVTETRSLYGPVMGLWEATRGFAYNKPCWSMCHQGRMLGNKTHIFKQVIMVPYACLHCVFFSGRIFKHFTNLYKGSLTSHWDAVVSRVEERQPLCRKASVFSGRKVIFLVCWQNSLIVFFLWASEHGVQHYSYGNKLGLMTCCPGPSLPPTDTAQMSNGALN